MINPTSANYSESMSTLKFGQMAAKIKVEANQNIMRTVEIKRQANMKEIEFLRS